MGILYIIFTLLAFIFLSLDAFFYPGFSLHYFYLDAMIFFMGYIALTFMAQLSLPFQKIISHSYIKMLFVFVVIFSLVLLLIEKLTFSNFVFSRIHLHPFAFMYIPLFFSVILFGSSLKEGQKYKLLFYTPLVFLLVMHLMSVSFETVFREIIQEDHLLEYMQFTLFLSASIYAITIYFVLKKQPKMFYSALIFLLFGIGLFLVAGEEISWGQRLLGLKTPNDINQINVQGEITVHNLKFFHYLLPLGYIAIGLYGSFSRLILTKLFKKYRHFTLFTPPYFLFFCFFTVALFFFQDRYGLYTFTQLTSISSTMYPHRWQEVVETVLAFGFFAYTSYTFTSLRKLS